MLQKKNQIFFFLILRSVTVSIYHAKQIPITACGEIMLKLVLSPGFINTLFIALFFATPIGAFLTYVFFHRRVKNLTIFIWTVILCGLIGPANLLLWILYNAIENRLGLDSVPALLINLAIFVVLGIAIGLFIRFGILKKTSLR